MADESSTRAKTALYGIKAIRDCCRKLELPSTEATVMAMIHESGLPAKKLGGIWISDAELIAEWRRKYVTGGAADGENRHPSGK
jgi:hypothetical protein